VPTLIFDEADAGVGGAVGEAIGQLMRTLGEARQVLCVTHLPQVAARAHQHLSVSKAEQGGRTVSRIAALDRQARIDEVARMLAGAEITATSRQHARELLAGA
jgi:DNA repair protein RecN (Recombination protein N)